MKILHILPILIALPTAAFAEETSSHIKPFVGYNMGLTSVQNYIIQNNGNTITSSENVTFNNNNNGNFFLGIEIDDIMALSVDISIDNTSTEITGVGTTTTQQNEFEAEFDLYLTRGSDFKPFISLSAGYTSVDGDIQTSGAIFGIGLGLRKYISTNVYLGANLSYKFSTEMNIKQISGTDVNGITMHTSNFGLGISAGYRF